MTHTTLAMSAAILLYAAEITTAQVAYVLDYEGNTRFVRLEQCQGPNGLEAQRWRIREVEDFFIIENVRLSRERGAPWVLDYDPNTGQVNLQLCQGPNGSEGQRWTIDRVQGANAKQVIIENVRLSREHPPSLVLDYDSETKRVNLQRRGGQNGVEGQRWSLQRKQGQDWYIIENVRLTRQGE